MGWNRPDWKERSPEQLGLYELLGRAQFDPDRLGLLADIKAANRELHEYQNHTSKQISSRARDWQLALAKARKTLESKESLHEVHQELIGHLVEKAQTKGLAFDSQVITQWLTQEEQVHPQVVSWVAQAVLTGDDSTFFGPWDALLASTWPSSGSGTDLAAPASASSLFPTSTSAPLYTGASVAVLPASVLPPASLPTADVLPPQATFASDLPVATPVKVAVKPISDFAEYRLAAEPGTVQPKTIDKRLNSPVRLPEHHVEGPAPKKEAGPALTQPQLILLIAGGGVASAIFLGLMLMGLGMLRATASGKAQSDNKPVANKPQSTVRKPSFPDEPTIPKSKTESGSIVPQRPAIPPAGIRNEASPGPTTSP